MLIAEGIDINQRNNSTRKSGTTGLILAIINGHIDLVRILLGCPNIKIDIITKIGWTALHYACERKRLDVVELLLKHPSCTMSFIMMKSKDGRTAEMFADKNGSVGYFTSLVMKYVKNKGGTSTDREKRITVDPKDFRRACIEKNIPELRRMIAEGLDVNQKTESGRSTGLIAAIHSGHPEVVRILLDCPSIKIDTTTTHLGWTALHYACQCNRLEIVELLLAHPKCNKNFVQVKSLDGMTVEMMADKKVSSLGKTIASLIKNYLRKNSNTTDDGNEKEKLEDLNLKEVAEMHADKSVMKGKTMGGNKRQLEILETDNKRKQDESLETIESDYKRKKYEILATNDVEDKKVFTDNAKTKKAFLPTCPVCYETIQPPLHIFTCSNGHLICSSCKPKVSMCSCQAMYMERATVMEQMVRMILNIK